MRIKQQNGFTLTELLLAMAIFSMVMMIATVGFIGMNRMYLRGTTRQQLSESARLVGEDITKTIRASGDVAIGQCQNPIMGYSDVRVGSVSYLWKQEGGLWKGNVNCDTASLREILGSAYTVRSLTITKLPAEGSLYSLEGVFTMGSDAGLHMPGDEEGWYEEAKCKGSAESPAAQSCALERFRFVVNGRGQDN